jgi:hypothetical protein
MNTKAWWQSKTVWGSIVAFIAMALNAIGIDISSESPKLVDGILNLVSLAATIFAIVSRIRARKVIAPASTQPIGLLLLLSSVLCLGLSSCASWYAPAKTEAGAVIAAKVADSVIDKGLAAAADAIDKGNPYLHSVAEALRANSGSIVSPADVQRIAINYGDPNNKAKFKTLAGDLWTLLKNATAQLGKVAGTELVAQSLNGTPPEKAAQVAIAVGK